MPAKPHLIPLLPCLTVFLALLGGCAKGGKGTFILLPDPDGRVGEITVTRDGNTQTVDEAWHRVQVSASERAPSPPELITQEQVEEEFGTVFAGQPVEPARFILHFQMDSTELTADSRALLPKIIAEAEKRASVDTSVVGHTDTSGSAEYNYELSLRRAQAVAELLIAAGLAPDILEINSHGEENLLVPTADDVDEPRNRRVEVTVR